jgi:hypothetical protein
LSWFSSLFKQTKKATVDDKVENVLEISEPAIIWCASAWAEFHQTILSLAGTEKKLTLSKEVFTRALEAVEKRLKKDYPILDCKEGEVMIAVFLAKGIEASGTHTRDEIEKATGVPIPF